MGVSRAVVFDLDDTLYLESEYVASGFRAVAGELGRRTGMPHQGLFAFLWERFASGKRGDHFDRLLEHHPGLSSIANTAELISLYRNHPPAIGLLVGVRETLALLEEAGVQLGLITDGPVASQTAKIRTLGLESRIAHRVQTDNWGLQYRKPCTRAFVHMASRLEVNPEQCIYVGDNPQKDFTGPNLLGWNTVRLRMPSQLHFRVDPEDGASSPRAEVHSIAELSGFLRRWCDLR